MAFDPDGRLYVADPGRGDIQVFDKKGRFVRIIGSQGSGNGQFDRLGVPFVDPATGDLWVPDFANRRVEVMTANGAFVAAFGDDPGEQTFDETNGVVLDRGRTDVGRRHRRLSVRPRPVRPAGSPGSDPRSTPATATSRRRTCG